MWLTWRHTPCLKLHCVFVKGCGYRLTSVCFFSPVGQDAANGAVPGGDLLSPAVFRCCPLPADEWEETHLDLSCLWQEGCVRESHHWWVSSLHKQYPLQHYSSAFVVESYRPASLPLMQIVVFVVYQRRVWLYNTIILYAVYIYAPMSNSVACKEKTMFGAHTLLTLIPEHTTPVTRLRSVFSCCHHCVLQYNSTVVVFHD